jgi:hypothetical protein
MTTQHASESAEIVTLLKQLLAIELWRGGLSQSDIRSRLGLNMNALNAMLKGVSRAVPVSQNNRGSE